MNRWTSCIRIVGIVALMLQVAACSSFKGSRRLDMGPFAENTVNMLAEAQKTVQPFDWNYLREYRPEANRGPADKDVVLVRSVFRGIGLYSVQVVSLSRASMSETKRAGKLGDYIEDVCRPIITQGYAAEFGITATQLDSVVANVRRQTDYLDAIGAANPLIYSIVTFTIERVDSVEAAIKPGLDAIGADIEAKFAETRREIDDLNAIEERDVRTFITLQDYRAGKASLESVVASDPSLSDILSPKGKSSPEGIEAAQQLLRERLTSIDAVRAQLNARKELHANQVAELDGFRNELDRRVRSARLMLVYWLRSHSNLAAGVQVPPAIDVGGMVGSSAKKAVKTVVP